jgi:hypothetical protein
MPFFSISFWILADRMYVGGSVERVAASYSVTIDPVVMVEEPLRGA